MFRNSPNSTFVKIADAAKILGVHKDTLRRWEKDGKIKVIRSLGGIRLYDISELSKILVKPHLNHSGQPIQNFNNTHSPLVKIAEAADILNVHKDTLRRWEKDGKIPATHEPNNDRLFHLDDLSKLAREKNLPLTTEELLNSVSANAHSHSNPIPNHPFFQMQDQTADQTISKHNILGHDIDIQKNLMLFGGFLAFLVITTVGVVAFFKQPFELSTKMETQTHSNQMIAEGNDSNVLAANTGPITVKINANEKVTGSLTVDKGINGITLSSSADGITLTDAATGRTLTVSGDNVNISKSFDGTTTASVPGLNLTDTSKQIQIGSGANTGTITWTPTGNQTLTLPNATDTLVGQTTSDTLTNKTISGSSNTLSNIANSALTNSSITVTAGSGLSGGGAVSLGGSITLSATTSTSGITSVTNSDGTLTISPTTGAVIASLNLANANTWTATQTFSGNVGIGGSLTVSGNLIGPSTGTLGYFSRSGTTLSTTTSGDSLSLTGPATIAPSSGSNTALTLKAAPTGSNNIFDITSNDGTSTYFSVDSSGQLAGSAFKLTDVNNAIVGTAIEGQWTFNSAGFTYRRQITVNNTSGSTLPKNYEISVSLTGTNASQVFSNTRTDYNDLQVGYGGTPAEIARNVSSHTSSSVAFTFQLQADITAGQSATNYYLYYKSPNLASPAAATYTGSHQLESMDTTTGWTSGAPTGFPISQDTVSPQEGSASLKAQAVIDKMGTFATTNQEQLAGGLSELAALNTSIGGTNYIYVAGGNNGSDVSTVYKSAITSNNLGAFTATANQLPQTLSGASLASSSILVATGNGSNGALNLSDSSPVTDDCSTWDGTTCTINLTANSQQTFNFTSVNIDSGKVLTINGPYSDMTTCYDDNGDPFSCRAGNTYYIPIFKVTGTVTIAGTINLAGKGYGGGTNDSVWPGFGPGAGQANSMYMHESGGGAGYGGAGGAAGSGAAPAGPAAGGSTYSTQELGSGGGSAMGGGSGREGGGGIEIDAGGNITINTINANGVNGNNSNVGGGTLGFGGGGAGSGGRITIKSNSQVTVTGSITANGGTGGSDTLCGGGGGGGGGGGLITMQDLDGIIAGNITSSGGSGGTVAGCPSRNGITGTSATPSITSLNPTLYVLGGKNGSSYLSTVYMATLSSTGDTSSTFATTSQAQLPQALYGHTSLAQLVNGSNYLYVLGGNNGTTDVNTVYKSTIDSGTGNIGAWSTASQGQLPQNLSEHAQASIAISGTTYVYIIGGKNGATSQTTVYKAAINSLTGDMGAFSAVSQGQLPVALYGSSAAVGASSGINYLYVIGGNNGSNNVDTVYRAIIDASGNIGTFSTIGQAQLPAALSGHQTITNTVSGTTYFYTLGGTNGSPVSTVYRSTIDNSTTGYTVTKTFSSTDFSKYNDLSFYAKSNSAGSYLTFALQTGGSTWQTPCAFSVTGSFALKTCDLTGITRTGVTGYRFISSSATDFTANFDDIELLTNSATVTNTASGGSAVLGAANLAVNAQGTGLVQINYGDSSHTAAGTGGLTVYNGGTTSLFTVDSNGNVGIGTSFPTFQLQTTGNVGIGGSLTVTSGVSLNSSLAVTGNTQLSTFSASGNVGIGGTATFNSLIRGSGLTMTGSTSLADTRLTTLITTGNVGIGSTTGGNKLDVWGNSRITGTLTLDSTLNASKGLFGYASGTNLSNGTVAGFSGNVGIGTTSPDRLLQTGSDINITSSLSSLLGANGTQFSITGGSAANFQKKLVLGIDTTDNYGVIQAGTPTSAYNLSLNPAGGNVGIGTTNPSAKLDVQGNIYFGPGSGLAQQQSITSDGLGSTMRISSPGTIFLQPNNGSSVKAQFGGTASEGNVKFFLNNSGNVGIGTTDPTAKLDVNADCSSFQTSHQCTDYAEYYPASETVDTGEILVIDDINSPDKIVKKSNSPYQKEIIGIVSTNPAVVVEGNSVQLMTGAKYTPDPLKPAVALAGRVPLKVSTENGPIQQGDYLTSSSIPGVAMKATRPGQVVGKALEDYSGEGIGKILTFVNVTFADPGNFLASLSMDSDGNLIVPKIKTGSLILDPSIASASSQLTADNQQLGLNPDPNFNNPGPNLANNTNQYIDLSGEIASLEDRIQSSELKIKNLEEKVATQAAILAEVQGIESSRSATPSASVLASNQNPSATDSGVTNAPQNDNLNLTPPDLLLATGSATLANINITSEATVSGMLTAYNATIQQTFKSLGQTMLGKTLVAGDLTIDGTMSLTGNSVNSISTLYLQNNPLSGSIDMFNGLVTVTNDGTIIAKKIQTDKLILGASTLGSGVIKAGSTESIIEAPALTEKSKVFVTSQNEIDTPLYISNKIIGQSFSVKIKIPLIYDVLFDWSIIDNK